MPETIDEIYGDYYKEKGREIPRTSSLDTEAKKLWREMEQAAHACVYQDGSYDYLDECVNRLANHPGCSWQISTINYWIRQNYYK
tara:strand:+ start:374 stop:628 length:255 start_codon:yes stop_codon:yes gene_type:complete